MEKIVLGLHNIDFVMLEQTTGKYQMPIIRKQIIDAPKNLTGFNYVLSAKETNSGVHMFLDDYQIERLWRTPLKYIEKLRKFDCVFSPDYSVYRDMPVAMQIWNVFRSRLVGQIMQDNEIPVVPTVSWGLPVTFDFAFDGIESGAIVAVSTIGVKRDKIAKQIWRDGMDEMIKRIQPSEVWVYGGEIEYDYKDILVKFYDNQVTKRMEMREKNGGARSFFRNGQIECK